MSERSQRDIDHAALLARVDERTTALAREMREAFVRVEEKVDGVLASMRALEARERERNGQIAELTRWRASHEIVAAQKIAELEALEAEHRDGRVRAGVWKEQLRWFGGGAAAMGGIATAVFAVLRFVLEVL